MFPEGGGVGWGGSGRVGAVNLGSYFEQKEGGMEGRKRRVAAGHQGASVKLERVNLKQTSIGVTGSRDDCADGKMTHTLPTPSSTLLIRRSRATPPAGQRNLSLDGGLSRHIWPISSERADSPPPSSLPHSRSLTSHRSVSFAATPAKRNEMNVGCWTCGTTTVVAGCLQPKGKCRPAGGGEKLHWLRVFWSFALLRKKEASGCL